jgi:hypothetical protein
MRPAVPNICLVLSVSTLLMGCGWNESARSPFVDPDLAHYVGAATRIDYPDVESECGDCNADTALTPRPVTLADPAPVETWDLSLEEAVHLALENSQVLRDLGGSVVRAPDAVNTIHSPAIRETDPQFGVEAALSAFDASWSTQAFFEKNDRAINNSYGPFQKNCISDFAVNA